MKYGGREDLFMYTLREREGGVHGCIWDVKNGVYGV
jgi:hypothetical protein